ncbi:aldo/keto reductase [Ramlibacter montanisoli]|uniref:aldo/keto reductase n=1 Tax=Ramlibacter montanisoli TaxID=2732512 RepID=UPI00209C2EE9|nr:aldo/keto reductase [Ramlibacter montanisoli]
MKRRTLLQWSALAAAGPALAQGGPLTRAIPSSGEQLPRVGLGTWITFNVGQDPPARAQCAQVVRAFLEAGGRLVDSSPMYGSSQGVVGDALRGLGAQQKVFSADKVWTSADGASQARNSRKLWQVPRFDLLQVHNLLAWEKQLPLLQAMKERGQRATWASPPPRAGATASSSS